MTSKKILTSSERSAVILSRQEKGETKDNFDATKGEQITEYKRMWEPIMIKIFYGKDKTKDTVITMTIKRAYL